MRSGGTHAAAHGLSSWFTNLASVMHLHHWLAWLAVNLAILLLGVGMSQPPPEPVAMAAFDDAYLVPTAPRGSVTGPGKSRHADEI
jgi:hypothetical protein